MKQATKRIAILTMAASMLAPMASAAQYASRAEKRKAMKEVLANDKAAIKVSRVYTDKNAKTKGFPWMKQHDVKQMKAPKAFKEGMKTTTADTKMKAPKAFKKNPNAIYGCVLDMEGWPLYSYEKPYGMYEVTQQDGNNVKNIEEHHGFYAGGGGVLADGTYYAIDDWPQSFMGYSFVTYYTYDANTWRCIGDEEGYDFTDEGSISSDLAFDPTTGYAYGTFLADESVGEEGPFVFGKMYFDDGPYRGEAIAECGEWYLSAIGCTASGKLYGIDPEGKFYSINKTTGDKILIADTGLVNEKGTLTSGTIDPYTGKFIYFLPSEELDEVNYKKYFYVNMYSIDCATGSVTKIGAVQDGAQFAGAFMYPAPPSSGAPGAVTNLTVTPGADGALKATVSCTAPTIDAAGAKLSQLERIDVKLGMYVVDSKECEPGENVTFEITTEQGDNQITVIPYNVAGAGAESRVSVFTGVDLPADPTETVATVQPDGSVLISWQAPSLGQNGGFVDPAKITYNIYSSDAEHNSVASRVNATSYVFTPSNDSPKVIRFQIFARNEAGGSEKGAKTNSVPIGKAYELPFKESFPNAYVTSGPWTVDQVDEAEWGMLTDQGKSVYASDGDNGFAVFFPGETTKSSSMLYSVKIDISKASKPMLTFMYAGDANRIKAQVAKNGEAFETVKTIDLNANPASDWSKATVDLADFKGADFIQIGFLGEAVNDLEKMMLVDDIRVIDNVGKDIAAVEIKAPARVQVGKEFEAVVTVENRGTDNLEAFKVMLMRNGNVVAEQDGGSLEADKKSNISFNIAAAPAWGKSAELSARVVCQGDEATYNDLCEATPIIIEQAAYPTTTLSINTMANHVLLEWTPVTLDNIKVTPIVEDFEDPTYEDFTISDFGDWTLRDEDKSKSTYVVGIPVPGYEGWYSEFYQYPNVGAPMAFQLLNPRKAGMLELSPEWTPKSGDRMMVAFNAEYAEDQDDHKTRDDDWLISPLLPGTEQTISLWARACSDEYGPEKLQILYSETGKDINDFVRIKSLDITGKWTEVTAQLPEGAKYFAVRCTSLDVFALMVDDIKFIPDWQLPADCDVTGYNLYRNGVKLNEAPLTVTSYDVQMPEEQNVEFVATVVYSNGVESCASNRVMLNESGVANVNADALAIFGGKGAVNVITPREVLVQVFDASGRLTASELCNGSKSIALPAGIYIVKAGSTAVKTIVR